MSQSRNGWRVIAAAASVLALLVSLAPAASGASTRVDSSPSSAERLGLDDLGSDVAKIKLRCGGRIADTGPVAACQWRTASTEIVTVQLWRLQLRIDDAERVLVTEVGADVHMATDGAVTAPGAYLYAVLGLDAEGDIVARSRVERVRFRDPSIESLRLDCDALIDTSDPDLAVEPSIGCSWSAAEQADVRAYNLYRLEKGQERRLLATLGQDTTGYVDRDVEAGVRYIYRVEGVDAAGIVVARSRPDSAGWSTSDRGEQRDERRDERRNGNRDGDTDRRGDRDGADAAVEAPADARAVDDGDIAEQEALAGSTSDTVGREVTADAERAEPDTRPDRERRDRPERGR